MNLYMWKEKNKVTNQQIDIIAYAESVKEARKMVKKSKWSDYFDLETIKKKPIIKKKYAGYVIDGQLWDF